MDMRKEIRYRLGAPAVFLWEGEHHRCFQGEGITRDISVQGAYIVANTSPPEGPVRVDFLLPAIQGMSGQVRISGRARVVRIDHPSGHLNRDGFAVVVDGLLQWALATIHDDSETVLAGEVSAAIGPDGDYVS